MITGDEFVQLAGKLVVLPGTDEAGFRTAVSRAYYGAFHLARGFLDEIGFAIPENLNAHGYLQNQLLNCGHSDAKTAGETLRLLHRNRLSADYRVEDRRFTTRDFAGKNVELAHEFRSLLDRCRVEPARGEVQSGIAEYQSKLS
jgi:uncharacterized protein (UPF0332 family)